MYQLTLKADEIIIMFNIKYKIKDSTPCLIIYMYIKIIIPFSPVSSFYFFCPYLIVDTSTALVTLEEKGYMVWDERSLEMIALSD